MDVLKYLISIHHTFKAFPWLAMAWEMPLLLKTKEDEETEATISAEEQLDVSEYPKVWCIDPDSINLIDGLLGW